MEHAIGNIVIYILGISLGAILSRYLYLTVKRKDIFRTFTNNVAIILNVLVGIAGFVVGFITIVIIHTIFYIIKSG